MKPELIRDALMMENPRDVSPRQARKALEWKGASNVAPKRRVRPTDRKPWRCRCQEWHPGYVLNCPKCHTERSNEQA